MTYCELVTETKLYETGAGQCRGLGKVYIVKEINGALVSRCQKAGQRQRIKIGNRSFDSVAKFKYL
jgi:hypothetical protein